MSRALRLILVSCAVLAAAPALARGPSYDCRRAATPTEFAICDNDLLAGLDRALADAYRAAAARGTPDLIARQRAWLAERDHCGVNLPCLAARMRTRIAELEAPASSGTAPGDGTLTGLYCPDASTALALVDRGDTAVFNVSLFSGNGHSCGTPDLTARLENGIWVARDGDCTLTVARTDVGLRLTASPVAACQRLYCGARAAISTLDFPFASRSAQVTDPLNRSFMEQGCD